MFILEIDLENRIKIRLTRKKELQAMMELSPEKAVEWKENDR